MRERKQLCAWPGNVCQSAQINLASTPDVAEVELPLSSNPNDGVTSSGWTLIRNNFFRADRLPEREVRHG
jgi:hypothetical protein